MHLAQQRHIRVTVPAQFHDAPGRIRGNAQPLPRLCSGVRERSLQLRAKSFTHSLPHRFRVTAAQTFVTDLANPRVVLISTVRVRTGAARPGSTTGPPVPGRCDVGSARATADRSWTTWPMPARPVGPSYGSHRSTADCARWLRSPHVHTSSAVGSPTANDVLPPSLSGSTAFRQRFPPESWQWGELAAPKVHLQTHRTRSKSLLGRQDPGRSSASDS